MLVLAVGASGCTTGADDDPDRRAAPVLTGCGPLSASRVVGDPPPYVGARLDRFANDHAACAGVWLRAARTGFVPQGVAVAGRSAWVSGYDGDAREGQLWCTVIRVDLRTGHEIDRTVLVDVPVDGQVVSCRHAGGITVDRHGLWLAEAGKLWLLDPDSLAVERRWTLESGVRGSFLVIDDEGRLGTGAFRQARRGWLDWLDPAALMASADRVVDSDDVLEHVRAPRNTQGAFWGDLDGRGAALWFARSHTRCGVLVGPHARRGTVPGIEGMAPAGRHGAWVVSESGSRRYQREGGRPVVPTLVRLDVADVGGWAPPDCSI